MDETTLYFYLLSTIAQTLGAILGLVSVFLVFRIQILEQRWKEAFDKLIETGKELSIDRIYLVAPDDQALNSVRCRVEEWEADAQKRNLLWVKQGRTLLTQYDHIRDNIKEIMKGFCFLALLFIIVIAASVFGIIINWYPPSPPFNLVCHLSFWGFLIALAASLGFVVYALRGASLFKRVR